MKLINIAVGIASIMFLMIATDKFFPFIEPPCTLEANISPYIWKFLGVLQFSGAVLIWLPKFRKAIAGFFVLFMLFFTGVHLVNSTYDIGGAVFMASLMGLIIWNPAFLNRGRQLSKNS